jgi:hypothetical protein
VSKHHTTSLVGLGLLSAAFKHACCAAPHAYVERWYALAGMPVRMRIAGRALAAHYEAAFAHLRTATQPVDAACGTIDLWDEAATGVPCPSAVLEEIAASVRKDLVINIGYLREARVAWYTVRDTCAWLDRPGNHVLGCYRDGQHVTLGERTRPLAPLLSIWLHDHDVLVIHAGLVAWQGRGVLFGGAGGAGKSTSALACLSHGFDYLGDDQVGLQEQEDGQFLGYSLFNTTRVAPDHLARFPLLHPHATASEDPADPKSLVFLSPIWPGRVIPSVPIHAVLLPHVCDLPESRLRTAARGEALLHIAQSTLLQLHPSPGQEGLRRLARLTARVPTYWLDLGRDLASIPIQVEIALRAVGDD